MQSSTFGDEATGARTEPAETPEAIVEQPEAPPTAEPAEPADTDTDEDNDVETDDDNGAAAAAATTKHESGDHETGDHRGDSKESSD